MSCKSLAQDIDQSIAATSNSASDNFVFTRNGTAFKIPFASMISSMGVTGKICSVGSPSSVALLNQPSAGYNFIRGLEPSKGISAGLSPQGGVYIRTNLANAGGDVNLIKDVNTAQIAFRGLEAGSGINLSLSADGNTIIISAT